jgi:hypothetical protein
MRSRAVLRHFVLLTSLAWLLAGSAQPADATGPCSASVTSAPVTDEASAVLLVHAPPGARRKMESALKRIVRLLPRPGLPYRLGPDGTRTEIADRAGKLDRPGFWAPLEASAERSYETGSGDDAQTLDQRVSLNGMRGLSPGLASVGGPVVTFDLPGAPSWEQTLIGAESRVALPLSPEQKARAVTLLRIYVVTPDLEARLRAAAGQNAAFPSVDPSQLAATRADAVRSVIVELYGPRRDIERLARHIPIAKLRAYLGAQR